LSRALAMIVNIVDPDAIVLGGGVSRINALYERLPAAVSAYAFTRSFSAPIVRNMHGDSSGVRGAAWLR
jgi:fructokinase